ncbi:hypothetical protein M758_7G089500 [Ceratodon purpureus]|nr:hypothetical protein M758_7G089500 [Ceratodon purpureus]KAG0610766.1 hypothetical protein M758_7G089500 [Ceratodon purpureus]
MEQDGEQSQRSKRCKLETITQDESQLNPIASNDTINSNSINSHTSTEGRKRSYQGDGAAEPMRRCTHCQTDCTPQWRAGPMGPRTLCNACGVQFHKFGKLLPEYRPAASPTYVVSKHTNSHKNAVKLSRREPEMRSHQPTTGLAFQSRPNRVPGSSDSVHNVCTPNLNFSNIDISKFLKPHTPLSCIIKSHFLMKMLAEGTHADVTLKAQGGSVRAHRCVLASVSSFFATMFKHPEEKHYEMQDMTIDCLQLFLVLLYLAYDGSSDTVKKFEGAIDKHLVELLKVYRVYDVEKRLMSILTKALGARNLSPENCWQLYNASGGMESKHTALAFLCNAYIFRNFDKVLESGNIVLEMKRNPELILRFMKQYTLDIKKRSR